MEHSEVPLHPEGNNQEAPSMYIYYGGDPPEEIFKNFIGDQHLPPLIDNQHQWPEDDYGEVAAILKRYGKGPAMEDEPSLTDQQLYDNYDFAIRAYMVMKGEAYDPKVHSYNLDWDLSRIPPNGHAHTGFRISCWHHPAPIPSHAHLLPIKWTLVQAVKHDILTQLFTERFVKDSKYVLDLLIKRGVVTEEEEKRFMMERIREKVDSEMKRGMAMGLGLGPQ